MRKARDGVAGRTAAAGPTSAADAPAPNRRRAKKSVIYPPKFVYTACRREQ